MIILFIMLMTVNSYAGIDFRFNNDKAMVVDITIPEFYSVSEAETWAHTFEGVDPIRRKLRDYIINMKKEAGVLSQEDIKYPERIINYSKKVRKISIYEVAYEIMLDAKENKGASMYAGAIPLK